MTFIPKKRKALLIQSGPTLHLHIIITDANEQNSHLLVPISSIKEGQFYDDTCVIKASEKLHPFIKKDSFVYYSKIQSRHAAHITRCVEENAYIVRDDICEELFTRICEGAKKSKFIPKWAKIEFLDSLK